MPQDFMGTGDRAARLRQAKIDETHRKFEETMAAREVRRMNTGLARLTKYSTEEELDELGVPQWAREAKRNADKKRGVN